MSRAPIPPVLRFLLLCALAAGCATTALPPEEWSTPVAGQALERAQHTYLRPEQLTDRRLLVGALDALEQRFDSVRFVESDAKGWLFVGAASAQVPLPDGFDLERVRRTLGRVIRFVDDHLPEDERTLEEDETLEILALRGALLALDPYTTVVSGRSTEDFRIRFTGKLFGIGARVGRRDGHLTAITVFPGSPAERGGLRDGDWIVEIDGRTTRALSVSEAVDLIRGPSGTRVTLGVQRGDDRHELEIVRREVTVPSVDARRLGGGAGYARIFQMSTTTAEEFEEKVTGLGPLRGLVLDLRGNTGGSLRSATELADLFLSRDLIVRVVDRQGPDAPGRRNHSFASAGAPFDFPVVVLVDASTASAAEILAGAIAPLDRVTLVGQTTFGKGLVQQVLPLLGENLLKITVAEYLLSGDRAIHEKGIEPDLVLHPVSADHLGALARVPEGALAYLRTPGEDDAFPIDVGQALLSDDPALARERVRARAHARIAEAFAPIGVQWRAEEAVPAEPALEIELRDVELTAGIESTVSVRVRNPHAQPIPDAWVALVGGAPYLANRLVSLGAIPSGGEAEGHIPVTPPEGLSARNHPILVAVSSGDRPLASHPFTLRVATRPPELEIALETSVEEVRIALHNLGSHAIGTAIVSLPGAVETVESLAPGASHSVVLSLAEHAKKATVTLLGPWAQRRIELPLPQPTPDLVAAGIASMGAVTATSSRTVVRVPHIAIDLDGRRKPPIVTLFASAPEGLRGAWIVVGDQKETYVDLGGRPDSTLQVPIPDRAYGRTAAPSEDSELPEAPLTVTTKVEMVGGVEIIDVRGFALD